jgi:arsenate reductase (thioredoxin)
MPKPASTRPVKIAFVCVGNSCRSQMAEAFAKQIGAGHVLAWSAGSRPLGEIIEETETVLEEKGISLEGHWSKSLKDIPVAEMDAVVGMGCEVVCPVPVGFKGRVIEWNIPDPYGESLDFFRSVRDSIERQVRALVKEMLEQRKGPASEEQTSSAH